MLSAEVQYPLYRDGFVMVFCLLCLLCKCSLFFGQPLMLSTKRCLARASPQQSSNPRITMTLAGLSGRTGATQIVGYDDHAHAPTCSIYRHSASRSSGSCQHHVTSCMPFPGGEAGSPGASDHRIFPKVLACRLALFGRTFSFHIHASTSTLASYCVKLAQNSSINSCLSTARSKSP